MNCDILLKNLIFVEFIAEWDICLNYTIVTENIKLNNIDNQLDVFYFYINIYIINNPISSTCFG